MKQLEKHNKSKLDDIIKIVYQSSNLFIEGFNEEDKQIKEKLNKEDLVTYYDVAIENFLKEELLKKFPNYNFICEESESISYKDINNTFIIDPIDGTKNFTEKNPFCCISILVSRVPRPLVARVN